ncbi:MAG: hypothetical protein ACTSXG_01465 [Alphaproteobacteria bacterium]
MKKDFILEIYKNAKTIFSFKDIALLLEETNSNALKSKIHYYVKTGKLQVLRKGIYAKDNYNALELATHIYSPTYISLETVLKKEGLIFQHDEHIYAISYMRKSLKIEGHHLVFRKIKNEILYNHTGINYIDNVPIASKERAFLDTLYLYKNFHFDNLDCLDNKKIKKLLKIYQNKTLTKKVNTLLSLC